MMKKTIKLKPRTFLVVLTAIAVLITGFSSFTVVPAGHTGVVSRFGAVQEGVLTEGLHLKIPFVESVTTIDNRVNVVETSFTAASKDLQTVTGAVSVNYRISPDSSANVYRNFGLSVESTLVVPAVPECIKAVTARYSAEELITMRQTVSDEIKESIDEKIRPYGLYVEVFNITDFSFSEEFNAAIEAKQTAQQNALKAEQDLQRVKIEAEQEVEQAKAEAESYRLKNEQLTDKILLSDWIEKWDGHLPTVTGGDGSSMMLDISGLLEAYEQSGGNTTAESSSQAEE
ncbi:MAG: prohibitin family protein [Acutalibacteraceae bacterium]